MGAGGSTSLPGRAPSSGLRLRWTSPGLLVLQCTKDRAWLLTQGGPCTAWRGGDSPGSLLLTEKPPTAATAFRASGCPARRTRPALPPPAGPALPPLPARGRGSQQPRADQAAQTPARGRPGQGSPEGGSNPEGARAMPRVGAAVPRRGRWCWAPGRWATVRGPAGPGCSEGGQPRRQHGGPEVPQAGPREARQPQFPHPSQGRGRPCPTGQQACPPGPRRGAGWPGALRKGREGEGRAGWGASLRSAWARVRFRNSPGRPKKSRPRSCHWPCSGGCICPHPVLPAPPSLLEALG